ncbi:DUF192 domain-containing protein [Haloparvum sp. PAK95]|uniref:DUF192 domain-containing protein n=1 Tax=Haloparvum sp. PAK95 TaxID=3418962 RepID=UPI003D2EFF9F
MGTPFDGRSRRAFLAAVTATSVAGCLEGDVAPAEGDGETTATETPAESNPSSGASTATERLHADYETTEVDARTPDGALLGSVTAAIADTPELRYTGLSDTESLPSDRGMIFVYDEVGDHTYVMREMDFGIDIVYADDEGVITEIHHAPAPGPNEDGNDQEYPGRGQYVLEVVYDWTTDHGVEVGDRLEFEL